MVEPPQRGIVSFRCSKYVIGGCLLLAATRGWTQDSSTIKLPNAQFSLSVPVMTIGDDHVLYVAYRSSNLLKKSNRLELAKYEIASRKEILHVSIPVPEIRGPRASNGLYLSRDGKTLAYAELHSPYLLVLVSTADLAEVRRSTVLPFKDEDHLRSFFGFDEDGDLCFASNRRSGLRFLRMSSATLKVVSETSTGGPRQSEPFPIVWSPDAKVTWIFPSSGLDTWKQYTETGQATGQELRHRGSTATGAIAVGARQLLAFFGQFAKGEIDDYNDHNLSELSLTCAPHPYGSSNDPAYNGALCTTQRDALPEASGDRVLTSEFLLLRSPGPQVVWRHQMRWVGISEGTGFDNWFQSGNALIYHSGHAMLVVAPAKSPVLALYEVNVPD